MAQDVIWINKLGLWPHLANWFYGFVFCRLYSCCWREACKNAASSMLWPWHGLVSVSFSEHLSSCISFLNSYWTLRNWCTAVLYRFIIGFFLAAIPWYVGAFVLICVRVHDYREKPGYVACTIAVSLFLAMHCSAHLSSCVPFCYNIFCPCGLLVNNMSLVWETEGAISVLTCSFSCTSHDPRRHLNPVGSLWHWNFTL